MRNLRIAENLKRELANILQESADPRFIHITITGAKVTKDLKHATIYFTTMRHPEAGKALSKATGYFKSQLAKRLDLKYLPELNFEEDKSYEYGQKIDGIINSIEIEEAEEADSEM